MSLVHDSEEESTSNQITNNMQVENPLEQDLHFMECMHGEPCCSETSESDMSYLMAPCFPVLLESELATTSNEDPQMFSSYNVLQPTSQELLQLSYYGSQQYKLPQFVDSDLSQISDHETLQPLEHGSPFPLEQGSPLSLEQGSPLPLVDESIEGYEDLLQPSDSVYALCLEKAKIYMLSSGLEFKRHQSLFKGLESGYLKAYRLCEPFISINGFLQLVREVNNFPVEWDLQLSKSGNGSVQLSDGNLPHQAEPSENVSSQPSEHLVLEEGSLQPSEQLVLEEGSSQPSEQLVLEESSLQTSEQLVLEEGSLQPTEIGSPQNFIPLTLQQLITYNFHRMSTMTYQQLASLNLEKMPPQDLSVLSQDEYEQVLEESLKLSKQISQPPLQYFDFEDSDSDYALTQTLDQGSLDLTEYECPQPEAYEQGSPNVSEQCFSEVDEQVNALQAESDVSQLSETGMSRIYFRGTQPYGKKAGRPCKSVIRENKKTDGGLKTINPLVTKIKYKSLKDSCKKKSPCKGIVKKVKKKIGRPCNSLVLKNQTVGSHSKNLNQQGTKVKLVNTLEENSLKSNIMSGSSKVKVFKKKIGRPQKFFEKNKNFCSITMCPKSSKTKYKLLNRVVKSYQGKKNSSYSNGIVKLVKNNVGRPHKLVMEQKKKVGRPCKSTLEQNRKIDSPRKPVLEQNTKVGRPRKTVLEENKKVGRPRKSVLEQNKKVGRPRKSLLEQNKNVGRPRKWVLEQKKEFVYCSKSTFEEKRAWKPSMKMRMNLEDMTLKNRKENNSRSLKNILKPLVTKKTHITKELRKHNVEKESEDHPYLNENGKNSHSKNESTDFTYQRQIHFPRVKQVCRSMETALKYPRARFSSLPIENGIANKPGKNTLKRKNPSSGLKGEGIGVKTRSKRTRSKQSEIDSDNFNFPKLAPNTVKPLQNLEVESTAKVQDVKSTSRSKRIISLKEINDSNSCVLNLKPGSSSTVPGATVCDVCGKSNETAIEKNIYNWKCCVACCTFYMKFIQLPKQYFCRKKGNCDLNHTTLSNKSCKSKCKACWLKVCIQMLNVPYHIKCQFENCVPRMDAPPHGPLVTVNHPDQHLGTNQLPTCQSSFASKVAAHTASSSSTAKGTVNEQVESPKQQFAGNQGRFFKSNSMIKGTVQTSPCANFENSFIAEQEVFSVLGQFDFGISSKGEREDELSPAAIAGLSFGVVLIVAGLAVTILFCYYVRRRQKAAAGY